MESAGPIRGARGEDFPEQRKGTYTPFEENRNFTKSFRERPGKKAKEFRERTLLNVQFKVQGRV